MAQVLLINKETGKSELRELSPTSIEDAFVEGGVSSRWDLFNAETGEPFVAPAATGGKSYGDKDAPGVIDSFARGAAQGATFGFADELANPLDKNERRISRENYDRAREANPGFYIAGDIAGGLVPGAIASVASGGAAGPAAAANATSKLAKVGQLLNTTKGSAALGAAQGALRAQGDSRDGWANQNDLALQTGAGAALGAAAPTVVKGAKTLLGGPLEKLKQWALPLFSKGDDAVDSAVLKAEMDAAKSSAEVAELAKVGERTTKAGSGQVPDLSDFTPTPVSYNSLMKSVNEISHLLSPADKKVLDSLPNSFAKGSDELGDAYVKLDRLSRAAEGAAAKMTSKQAGLKAAARTATSAQETMAQKQAALANKAAREAANIAGVVKSTARAAVPAAQAAVNPPVLQNIFDSNFKSWLKSTGRDYEKLSPQAKELLEKKNLSKKDKTALYEELLNDPQITEDEKTELLGAYSDALMENVE